MMAAARIRVSVSEPKGFARVVSHGTLGLDHADQNSVILVILKLSVEVKNNDRQS